MTRKELHGEINPAFTYKTGSSDDLELNTVYNSKPPPFSRGSQEILAQDGSPARDTWSHSLDFLMSCIAMSVGLGNVWRFPFTAYENGGGAFLIPYIIVLVLVGKPLYYMESILGQFSSKGNVKVFDFAPAMRGIGIGQTVAMLFVIPYYSGVISIILYYFFASFSSILPWSTCDPNWIDECYPSSSTPINISSNARSSSELYFVRTVLNELDNIEDGIGIPNWKLSICLLITWLAVMLVTLKGVKSSGKASYFLAICPYVIMLVLFIRAITLPGSVDGIIFFIKPNWGKILDAKVWYAAVTQSFFSLNVCFGTVIMYSSYSKFRHNIYRDTLVVTSLDTFTSLLSGFTIFGILGNLAHETGKDVADVVNGGTGLAFISYPDAISKFDSVPQVFSALFFLMLFVLGIGSNVANSSGLVTVIRDKFPHIKPWMGISCVAIFAYFVSHVYITPGGQFVLNLIDHHAGTFVVIILGIGQILSVSYIYGLRRFIDDVEFMTNRKIGIYWRICWSIITPLILISIFIYSMVQLTPLTYKNIAYPTIAIVCGWLASTLGVIQVPLFIGYTFWRKRSSGYPKVLIDGFKPSSSWGPTDSSIKAEWTMFLEGKKKMREERDAEKTTLMRFFNWLLGY